MSASKSILCFILVSLFCHGYANSNDKRGHHNSGGWGTIDCWDHGDEHLMNPFCASLEVCLTPIGIPNGLFSKPEVTLQGVEVVYTCKPGFIMVGQSVVICSQSNWGPTPKCVQTCPSIPSISHGSFQAPNETVFGTVVDYECDHGYSFENGSSIECQTTGKWSAPLPVCLPIGCMAILPIIPHGSFQPPNETIFGTVVDYVCDDGFSFENGSSIVCLTTGEWSIPLPVCLPKVCPDVPQITNGFFQPPNDTSIGTLVEYQCNTAYSFDNTSTILCLDNAKWSTPLPFCLPTSCPPIPVVDHAIFQPNITDIGTLIEYECFKGFVFENTSTIICLNDGQWTWPIPNCIPKGCPPYPSIGNGFSNAWTNDTDFGTTVQYQCNTGYAIENNDTIVCLDTGVWSKPTPVCLPIDCYPIPVIDNANMVGGAKSTYGSVVNYQCNDGFEFTDTNSTTCLITGYWSILPECKRTDCGNFPIVTNGSITEATNNTEVGALAMYKCDSGFELYGNRTIECLVTYEWTQPPNCEPVCTDAPDVTNAVLTSPKSNSNGDVLQYSCSSGFAFAGSDSITCANGTWTDLPVCTPAPSATAQL